MSLRKGVVHGYEDIIWKHLTNYAGYLVSRLVCKLIYDLADITRAFMLSAFSAVAGLTRYSIRA